MQGTGVEYPHDWLVPDKTSLKEIILINIFGEDKPGVTSSFTDILAGYEVNILDIGQSVIHDALSLGVLVELSEQLDTDLVLDEIRHCIELLGLRIRFSPISEHSYGHWVEGQGKSRYIITLLARKVKAIHLSHLTSVVAKYDLNIDNINRLSGRVPLVEIGGNAKACVEFSVRGELADIDQFRGELLHLATEFDIDIAFQEDNKFRRTRRLVAFDMDSTLIEAEVIDELAKAAGVGDKVAEITEQAMMGEIDFSESFRQRVSLLKGLDESLLEQVAESLPLTEGAQTLITTLKSLGYKTAILSGGFTYFGKRLQAKLGIDYVFANELEFVDGKVTGNVSGQIVDGERKAALLREIAEREGIDLQQVIAVGDGANDLPMLSIAGLGIAFRAKPLVKQSAKQAISTLGLDSILYLLGIGDRHQG